MSVFRAFIAIDLPVEVQERLDQLIDHLRQSLPDASVRWVPAVNIHLTVKFLGDVSEANYEMLTGLLRAEAAKHKRFVVSFGGLGAYPNKRRPRVIWVGVESPEELHSLQRGIEAEVTKLGYASEKRAYSPHLTLGRVSRNARSGDIRRISKVLKEEEVGYLGVARINTVHLYRSDLKSGGAVYSRLFTAELAAG
jgi:2'-5' RNA ligase